MRSSGFHGGLTRLPVTVLFYAVIVIFVLSYVPVVASADCRSCGSSKTVRTRIPLYSGEYFRPEGSFLVYMREGECWREAGKLEYDRFLRTRELTLRVPAGMQELRIRIEKEGGGAAHIDCVLLDGTPPEWAGGPVLDRISARDLDVVNAHEGAVEVAFHTEGSVSKEPVLSLTGRIEGERISKTPFQYPRCNTYRTMDEHATFYRYDLGTMPGRLVPDGDLGGERLDEPFFAERIPVGTGHPQGTTYGWVMNDEENLYVAVDFTADNTMDGNEDYTAVYLKTEEGLREYKVSMEEREWGNPGFGYTDKVPYQHKTYEFSIPLEELGAGYDYGNPMEIAFAAYGTAGPGEVYAAMAYDPNHHQYLVVFTYVNPGDNVEDIYGMFLNGTGAPLGSRFPICTAEFYQTEPAAAFDEGSNRFLVIWRDGRNSGSTGDDIYGRLIDSDGTFFPADGDGGNGFPVCGSVGGQSNPAVAVDQESGRFLVTWEDGRNSEATGYDIYGRLVNSDGTFFAVDGDENGFVICNNSEGQYSSSVAYDPGSGRFLTAWYDGRNAENGYDIYGRLLNSDGTVFSAVGDDNGFPICEALSAQYNPAVCADPGQGRFLVVWEENRNESTGRDVFGQLVKNDGSMFGVTDGFVICEADDNQYLPVPAFDGVNNRYLVSWYDYRTQETSGADIYGQYLDRDGGLYPDPGNSTDNIPVNADDYYQMSPSTIADPFCGNFLVAYESVDSDVSPIYSIVVESVGVCEPEQGLLAFPVGMDTGVDPVAGHAGEAFTFEVYYWGTDEPGRAELWLDRNGDGEYAAGPAAVLPQAPTGTGGVRIQPLSLVLVLLGIGGIGLLAVIRPRRKRTAAFAMFCITALLSIGIVTGCGGGGGDGTSDDGGDDGGGTVGVDTVPPVVTSVSPAYGAVDVDPGTVVTLTFSEEMNKGSVEGAFSLTGSSAEVSGDFVWSGDTVTFSPEADLEYETEYEVKVGTGGSDLAGNGLSSEYVSGFSTRLQERIVMTEDDSSDNDCMDGKLYRAEVTIGESGEYDYRFVFEDWNGEEPAGAPTETMTLDVD